MPPKLPKNRLKQIPVSFKTFPEVKNMLMELCQKLDRSQTQICEFAIRALHEKELSDKH